jgi:hypothetical protein
LYVSSSTYPTTYLFLSVNHRELNSVEWIRSSNYSYRIEIPFSSVARFHYQTGTNQIILELKKQPSFWVQIDAAVDGGGGGDDSGANGTTPTWTEKLWVGCEDFSNGMQIGRETVHTIHVDKHPYAVCQTLLAIFKRCGGGVVERLGRTGGQDHHDSLLLLSDTSSSSSVPTSLLDAPVSPPYYTFPTPSPQSFLNPQTPVAVPISSSPNEIGFRAVNQLPVGSADDPWNNPAAKAIDESPLVPGLSPHAQGDTTMTASSTAASPTLPMDGYLPPYQAVAPEPAWFQSPTTLQPEQFPGLNTTTGCFQCGHPRFPIATDSDSEQQLHGNWHPECLWPSTE